MESSGFVKALRGDREDSGSVQILYIHRKPQPLCNWMDTEVHWIGEEHYGNPTSLILTSEISYNQHKQNRILVADVPILFYDEEKIVAGFITVPGKISINVKITQQTSGKVRNVCVIFHTWAP